jgi:uncharacterized protein YndB with AHSA1/START domain
MPDDSDRILTTTVRLHAPVQVVYAAWTQPEHMRHWFGPKGFRIVACEMDARAGGRWRVAMTAPEGTQHVELGTVREIVPPQRLVLTHAWLRDDGKPGHETTITVTLTGEAGATRMTFRQGTFESVKSRDEHNDGWSSAFLLLAEHLLGIASPESLGRPGVVSELMQHARPHLDALRAQVDAKPKPTPKKPDA